MNASDLVTEPVTFDRIEAATPSVDVKRLRVTSRSTSYDLVIVWDQGEVIISLANFGNVGIWAELPTWNAAEFNVADHLTNGSLVDARIICEALRWLEGQR